MAAFCEVPCGSGKDCAGSIASSIAACDNHQRTNAWQSVAVVS